MADPAASHMVDVSDKPVTLRTAVAEARVVLSPAALEAVREGTLPKGRVEDVARIAGVMAAKECSRLIPFCHPVALSYVEVAVCIEGEGVCIRATARAEARTGVEMEALTAASVAALTVYDMCKAADPGGRIEGVRVISKRGGKSGDWGEGVDGHDAG